MNKGMLYRQLMKGQFRAASYADVNSGLSQSFTDIKWFSVINMKPFNHVHLNELAHFNKMVWFRPMNLTSMEMPGKQIIVMNIFHV